jgi:hypothetical protein
MVAFSIGYLARGYSNAETSTGLRTIGTRSEISGTTRAVIGSHSSAKSKPLRRLFQHLEGTLVHHVRQSDEKALDARILIFPDYFARVAGLEVGIGICAPGWKLADPKGNGPTDPARGWLPSEPSTDTSPCSFGNFLLTNTSLCLILELNKSTKRKSSLERIVKLKPPRPGRVAA